LLSGTSSYIRAADSDEETIAVGVTVLVGNFLWVPKTRFRCPVDGCRVFWGDRDGVAFPDSEFAGRASTFGARNAA
jgi:hypothetical protein